MVQQLHHQTHQFSGRPLSCWATIRDPQQSQPLVNNRMDTQEFAAEVNRKPRQRVIEYRDSFERFIRRADVRSLVINELRGCLADYKRPPPVVAEATLRLLTWDWLCLDLTVGHAQEFPSLLSTHQDVVQHFYADAEFRHYRLVDYEPNSFSLESTAILEREGIVRNGSTLVVDGSTDLYAFKSTSPLVYASLAEFAYDGIQCKFDINTGRVLGSYFTDPASTSLGLIAKFLGIYGDSHCVEPLEQLLSHKIASVSWEAAVALTHLDRTSGLNAMKQLRNSPNKLVARAATQTLSKNT